MDIKHNLFLRLKLHKLTECGIVAPIILYEAMKKKDIDVRLNQGWCGIDNEWGWHVWVVDKDDKIYDIHADLTKGDIENIKYAPHNEKPDGAFTDETVLKMWDEYFIDICLCSKSRK